MKTKIKRDHPYVDLTSFTTTVFIINRVHIIKIVSNLLSNRREVL